MNPRRMFSALIIGSLAGVFCAYGTAQMENPTFPITTGLLVSIFYNRLLIGIFVGIADNIELNSILRGAIIGAVVTMAMSVIPIVDGEPMGGITLLGFGMVYGMVADVVATRFS